MPCSVCGKNGHNSRTCNEIQEKKIIPQASHALWIKFDNITEEEANEILKSNIDFKSKIAPNARATFAKGSKQELPNKISEALMLQQKNTK